jgi:hypothetical protein
VHRHEKARIGVLVGDRRDPRPVEREVGRHVDIEEADRLAVAVDHRRALPRRPAVVVPTRCEHDGVVPGTLVLPRTRDLLGQLGVLGLEDHLPVGAAVPDDHAATSSAARTSAVVTTSPYFVSMS